MKINIRPIFRILGILFSITAIVVTALAIFSEPKPEQSDFIIMLVSSVTLVPLILSSSILGHVPYFITRHLPEESEDELQHTEQFFTEFSVKSFCFAIGFLIVAISMTLI